MIPLAVGVAAAAHLSLAIVFLCVAASYATTALVFRVPLPVQPMKAMGASIIALGLSASVVSIASIEIALLLLLLAVTPLASHLSRLFPKAVLRGIQLSVGLLLLKSGILMAAGETALPLTQRGSRLLGEGIGLGLLVACVVAAVLLIWGRRRRLPVSLVVIVLAALAGLVLAAVGLGKVAAVEVAATAPVLRLPSLADASLALFALVLPQLPLSLGNSVFATEDAMGAYYGRAAGRVTGRRLLVSLGLMNLGCGAVGGMPLCHGAGGATAHFRLGARTAGATLLAAALYAGLSVSAAMGISPLFVPAAVLAGMLLFVGVEHCLLVADLVSVDEVACALLVAVLALAFNNLALGFAVSWVAYTVALRRSPLQRIILRWPPSLRRHLDAGGGDARGVGSAASVGESASS